MKVNGKFVPNNSAFYPALAAIENEKERSKVHKSILSIKERQNQWLKNWRQEKHTRLFNPYLYKEAMQIVDEIEEISTGVSQVKSQGFLALISYASQVKQWDKVEHRNLGNFVADIVGRYGQTTSYSLVKDFWEGLRSEIAEAANSGSDIETDRKRIAVMSKLARYINAQYTISNIERCPLYASAVSLGNASNVDNMSISALRGNSPNRKDKAVSSLEAPNCVMSTKKHLAALADFDVYTYLAMDILSFAKAMLYRVAQVQGAIQSTDINIEAYALLITQLTDFIPETYVYKDYSMAAQKDEMLSNIFREDVTLDELMDSMSPESKKVQAPTINYDNSVTGDWGLGVIRVITESGHGVPCGFDLCVRTWHPRDWFWNHRSGRINAPSTLVYSYPTAIYRAKNLEFRDTTPDYRSNLLYSDSKEASQILIEPKLTRKIASYPDFQVDPCYQDADIYLSAIREYKSLDKSEQNSKLNLHLADINDSTIKNPGYDRSRLKWKQEWYNGGYVDGICLSFKFPDGYNVVGESTPMVEKVVEKASPATDPKPKKKAKKTPIETPVVKLETPIETPVVKLETPIETPVVKLETPVGGKMMHYQGTYGISFWTTDATPKSPQVIYEGHDYFPAFFTAGFQASSGDTPELWEKCGHCCVNVLPENPSEMDVRNDGFNIFYDLVQEMGFDAAFAHETERYIETAAKYGVTLNQADLPSWLNNYETLKEKYNERVELWRQAELSKVRDAHWEAKLAEQYPGYSEM